MRQKVTAARLEEFMKARWEFTWLAAQLFLSSI